MKNCLFVISMVLLSITSIATLICVNKLTESHRSIIESHRFVRDIDSANYNMAIDDDIQQEMICKIRLAMQKIEFEPENIEYQNELKWLISRVKEREHVKFEDHANRILRLIDKFLNVLPYLIIVNVILINMAFHKRCGDKNAQSNT